MKRNFLNLFAAFAALLVIFGLADTASAQRRARGRVYTKAEVGQIIKRVETRVDYFVEQFDKSLDKSKLDGTRREDRLDERARDLESATDELRSEFDRRDTWMENKDEVRKCLNIATDINKSVRNRKFSRATENNWANVRFELNTLAKLYNLPQIGSWAY